MTKQRERSSLRDGITATSWLGAFLVAVGVIIGIMTGNF